MTITEAIQSRHTVRKYIEKPMSVEIIKKLNARINENNKKYSLNIKLILNDEDAFTSLIKLVLAKGVKNYLVLSGKDTPDLDKKLGYSGADLMLYAQTLGLNTWWVGDTFNKKTIKKVSNGNKAIGVIAIGYGATQGIPHKNKKPEEISLYNGEVPEWFRNGVTAALQSPTALNKQSFMINGKGNKVFLFCNNGKFTNADFGLVKYHFEVGAGIENFEWENDSII